MAWHLGKCIKDSRPLKCIAYSDPVFLRTARGKLGNKALREPTTYRAKRASLSRFRRPSRFRLPLALLKPQRREPATSQSPAPLRNQEGRGNTARTCEIGEECSAGTLGGVVADIEKPEPQDVDDDGAGMARPGGGVAEEAAKIGGEADEEDGEGDGGGAADDEGAAAAPGAGEAVAQVADEGLDDEPREGPAEPHQACERVGDPQLLDVGGQQRELESPPELDAARHGRHPEEPPQRNPRRRRRYRGGRMRRLTPMPPGQPRRWWRPAPMPPGCRHLFPCSLISVHLSRSR